METQTKKSLNPPESFGKTEVDFHALWKLWHEAISLGATPALRTWIWKAFLPMLPNGECQCRAHFQSLLIRKNWTQPFIPWITESLKTDFQDVHDAVNARVYGRVYFARNLHSAFHQMEGRKGKHQQLFSIENNPELAPSLPPCKTCL